MLYFVTEASAGYGARIFIQDYTEFDTTNEVIGLHELAKELSMWKGADKSVTFPEQDCAEAWAKTGKPGFKGFIAKPCRLSGYEVDYHELMVLTKRCKGRGLINVTPILKDMKQEWH
jgi:hypothetical protein